MTLPRQTTCPHCGTRFQVEDEQLQIAAGRVRCGHCLQVFDGISGEVEFIAPVLRESQLELANVALKPMTGADFPVARPRIPGVSLLLAAILIVGLAAQVYLRSHPQASAGAAVELAQLVVRKHPSAESALRVEAILYNPGDAALPLPELDLRFSNRYGEARAGRVFTAAEYLHGDYQFADSIPARSQLQVSLSLQDPGQNAVNFNARLRTVNQSSN